ncbi:hypothetical protein A2U01_0071341, partial [Trifolium medium]|nr:hypothetical protein [Trifolium medium]
TLTKYPARCAVLPCALRQHQKKTTRKHNYTARCAGPAVRCANARRLNCHCTNALRVAPIQAARCTKNRKLNRPHSLNYALHHMHLRVAPDTEHEGIVAV